MPKQLSLDPSKEVLLQELLSDYLQSRTTPNQCQVCGAYRSGHTHVDCPVKLASDMLEELE